MKTRDKLCILVVAMALTFAVTPIGQHLIAQSSYSVQGWLGLVTDTTNDALQVSIVSTDSNQTIGGNLAVTGTSTLTGDVSAGDDVTVNGWLTIPSTTVTAQSYTISSTGKASAYLVDGTTTEAMRIWLPTGAADGTVIMVKDLDRNASSNNMLVDTEGSETVDGSATYTANADGEAIVVVYDEGTTDWVIFGGYGE